MSEEDIKAIRILMETVVKKIGDIAYDVNELKAISVGQQFKTADTLQQPSTTTTTNTDQPKEKEVNPLKPVKTVETNDKANILEIGKWCDIEGEMKDDPKLAKGNKQDGTEWKRANFRMNLPNTTVRVTLWGDLASEIMQYTAGEYIALNGMMVKKPYKEGGNLELSSGQYTKITIL